MQPGAADRRHLQDDLDPKQSGTTAFGERFEAMGRRFVTMEKRQSAMDEKMSRHFRWLVGSQVTVLVTVVGALAGARFLG